MSDTQSTFTDEARRIADDERRIQQEIDGETRSFGDNKKEGAMQAGARPLSRTAVSETASGEAGH